MRLPLLGGSYAGVSFNTSSQEMINFYWEAPAKHELHAGSAIPTPGAVSFNASIPGLIRGMIYNPHFGYLFAVAGNQIYKIDNAGTATALTNTLDTVSGPVSMCQDPSTGYMMLVDGTSGYRFNDTIINKITDTDFPSTPTACSYIDGFFLVNAPAGNKSKFQYSALNDCTSWDALDVEILTSVPTYIKQIVPNGRDIWFFGDTKSEVWYLEGIDPDHPFRRIERIESGLPGNVFQPVNLACVIDNSLIWPSQNDRGEVLVVRANGYLPQVISTPEISHKIALGFYSGGPDPLYNAYSYVWKGHEFYILNLMTIHLNLGYDASTGEWHTRSGTLQVNGDTSNHPYIYHQYCAGFDHRHIVATSQNTLIWYWDDTVFTHDGSAVERRITGPLIALENEARLRISEVQLDIEEGTGSGTIILSYSKDGGHTYSSGKSLTIGDGTYHSRLVKRKLGWGRLWNFRIYTNTTSKVVIKGLYGRIAQEPFVGFSQAAAGRTSNPLK